LGEKLKGVDSWMMEEGIEQHYDIFRKQKITGASLLELKALLSTEPPQTIKFFLVALS